MDKAPQGPSPILPRPKKSSKYPCGILKHKNSAHSTTHRTGLRKAISAASRRQLASLLYDACKQLEQMRELAALQLLAPEQNRQDVFETCRNCGEEYDVKMNQEHKDCVHHPGKAPLLVIGRTPPAYEQLSRFPRGRRRVRCMGGPRPACLRRCLDAVEP